MPRKPRDEGGQPGNIPAEDPAPAGSATNPVVLKEAPVSPMKTYPPPAVGPNADGMDKQAQNAQTRDEEE